MREEWRAVGAHDGLYEVSSEGRVRSLYSRHKVPKVLRLGTDETGYPTVMLSKDGQRKPFTVHRLVALAFHGDKRNALHREVAHLDGDRSNGRADNLKWVSKCENMRHKRMHGTTHGSKGNHLRLTLADARRIVLAKGTIARGDLARTYGLHPASISQIWSGARWKTAHRPTS